MIRDYQLGLVRNNGLATHRAKMIVGTATTGLLRAEWVQARMGQIIPTNWTMTQMWQYVAPGQFMAVGYQVDDAQNLIVAEAMRGDYDWLLLYEHDMLPAPDALTRLAEYIRRGDIPVVSALYFTRANPSDPLVYRGRGVGSFNDFDIGDLIWCDGVPTGYLLIHMSILRAMWEESEEYLIGHQTARRIFKTPSDAWYDPETMQFNTHAGTSDLAWCARVMNGGYFEKAGWPEYADKEYPFLIDTNIMCEHINNTLEGEKFPPGGVRKYWETVRKQRSEPIK